MRLLVVRFEVVVFEVVVFEVGGEVTFNLKPHNLLTF